MYLNLIYNGNSYKYDPKEKSNMINIGHLKELSGKLLNYNKNFLQLMNNNKTNKYIFPDDKTLIKDLIPKGQQKASLSFKINSDDDDSNTNTHDINENEKAENKLFKNFTELFRYKKKFIKKLVYKCDKLLLVVREFNRRVSEIYENLFQNFLNCGCLNIENNSYFTDMSTFEEEILSFIDKEIKYYKKINFILDKKLTDKDNKLNIFLDSFYREVKEGKRRDNSEEISSVINHIQNSFNKDKSRNNNLNKLLTNNTSLKKNNNKINLPSLDGAFSPTNLGDPRKKNLKGFLINNTQNLDTKNDEMKNIISVKGGFGIDVQNLKNNLSSPNINKNFLNNYNYKKAENNFNGVSKYNARKSNDKNDINSDYNRMINLKNINSINNDNNNKIVNSPINENKTTRQNSNGKNNNIIKNINIINNNAQDIKKTKTFSPKIIKSYNKINDSNSLDNEVNSDNKNSSPRISKNQKKLNENNDEEVEKPIKKVQKRTSVSSIQELINNYKEDDKNQKEEEDFGAKLKELKLKLTDDDDEKAKEKEKSEKLLKLNMSNNSNKSSNSSQKSEKEKKEKKSKKKKEKPQTDGKNYEEENEEKKSNNSKNSKNSKKNKKNYLVGDAISEEKSGSDENSKEENDRNIFKVFPEESSQERYANIFFDIKKQKQKKNTLKKDDKHNESESDDEKKKKNLIMDSRKKKKKGKNKYDFLI